MPRPQVPTCDEACLEALEEVELGTVGAVHEALLGLRSPALPAHLPCRLRGFEQRCAAALAELARAAPGTDGLLAPLLLAFGDVPATLTQEGLRRAAMKLPHAAVRQLASSDELRVTSENDVLVGQGCGRAVGQGCCNEWNLCLMGTAGLQRASKCSIGRFRGQEARRVDEEFGGWTWLARRHARYPTCMRHGPTHSLSS